MNSSKMKDQVEKLVINCPYGDLQTRNLILQVMDYDNYYGRERKKYIASTLEDLLGDKGEKKIDKDSEGLGSKLKELLEKKGKAFLHTPEYFAAIEDEQERLKSYKALKVTSTIPTGEEAEIAENPFKFLHLPEDATYGQTRAAWIRLSKAYFPDLMYPENPEQFNRIFGRSEFPIEGKDYDSWLEETQGLMPPERLRAEELEKLSPKKQEEYRIKHEAYREKELEYEKVKSEMRSRATEKMRIINKAYGEAKKRFSDVETESFAGFIWEKGKRTSEFVKQFYDMDGFDYDGLYLEGEGQIRRDMGEWALNNFVYLTFDYGDIYLGDNDYRQSIHLKPFFAWTELILGKELCPTLLEDVVDTFKLNDDQSEQLRLMIMNNERPEFIMDAFSISEKNLEHYTLLHFLDDVYEGPDFSHWVGPVRAGRSFPLGVQFTPKGGMILTYKSQEDQNWGWTSRDATAHFTPTDMQMMQAIAYGPLLKEPEIS